MALENMDFQPLVHQQVTLLIDVWKADGFSEDEIQETASQFFNMGLIAGQQVQQEGGITPQGTEHVIPYTEQMAERVVRHFLVGLSAAALKAHEQRLPSQEMWALMQNVAYHVFEQSKQAIVATLGQEHTPDVQISDEQINNWLGQTAIEALLYYINEHEKQYGPITRTDQAELEMAMPDLLNQPEQPVMDPDAQGVPAQDGMGSPMPQQPAPQQPVPAPTAQPVPQRAPEVHHKYAAVGLLLSSMSTRKQTQILSAFKPDEQQLIYRYQDPEEVARTLDLGMVAKYLRQFKEKMGQKTAKDKSPYASTLTQVIQTLPAQRLERLFQRERPLVRGYVGQVLANGDRDYDPYDLPTGVEESLLLYLHRNFPEEISVR